MFNLDVNQNNIINNYDNQENISNNANYNNNNLNYTYDYCAGNNSYIDHKEARQKRTLNEFKRLLNKIDEKIDMP